MTFNFQMAAALLRALMPVIVALLISFGVQINVAMFQLVTDHLVAILIGLGGLGAAFPSIKAAIKYKSSAD